MFLDDDEVVQLTGKQRRPAQARVLTLMGIEHRLRPDGSVAVLRAHVEKLFGGTSTVEKAKKKTEPNFAALLEWEREKAAKKKKKAT